MRERLGGLPAPAQAERIWHGIWLEETHHSTAIEGNTLVLKQVEQLLDEGRAVGNRELREYMEVRGYADAADWVYRHALAPGDWGTGEGPIALTELRHVHRIAMGPVWDVARTRAQASREAPGSFREHDMGPFPGGDASTAVAGGARAAVHLDHSTLETCEPVALPETLAALRAGVRADPSVPGRQRPHGAADSQPAARQLGYPPAVITRASAPAISRRCVAPIGASIAHSANCSARAILDNLYRFIVPALADPTELVPLPALASGEVSADALRVGAAGGRLKAAKGPDGVWRSSRGWVDEYLSGRRRRAT